MVHPDAGVEEIGGLNNCLKGHLTAFHAWSNGVDIIGWS